MITPFGKILRSRDFKTRDGIETSSSALWGFRVIVSRDFETRDGIETYDEVYTAIISVRSRDLKPEMVLKPFSVAVVIAVCFTVARL